MSTRANAIRTKTVEMAMKGLRRILVCLRQSLNLLRTSVAESLSLGSKRSIFLTRSLALLDIDGQGSEEKSRCPRRTASKIPCSFSVQKEQEILRLQIAVHNPHRVTVVENGNHLTAEAGGGAFGVVALGDDTVEELAAGAELHD
nr:uncharacterized protein LOC112999966 [Ipomoea trifida]